MKAAPPIQDAEVAARIVDGARRHFFGRGFRTVTMAELATELGMSKKTLYAHFASKGELLEAVVDAKLADAKRELADVMRGAETPFAQRLQQLLACMRKHTEEIQPAFVHDMRREDPKLFARIQAERRAFIDRTFGELMEQGRRAGTVRKDIPARVLVEMLLGAVDSVIVPAKVEELGITPNAAFTHVLSIFLEGALVRKGGRA